MFAYELRRVRIARRKQGSAMSLTEAGAWSRAWPWAKMVAMEVERKVGQSGQPWAEVWAQAETKAWAAARDVKARARRAMAVVEAAEARGAGAEAWPWGVMRTAEAEALALAGVLAWARGEGRARGERVPSGLADSATIWHILNRDGVARDSLHRTGDECWRVIHCIAPITRLPLELLQQIFLIIIDETSGPPLVLMRVCPHWHAIVTGIWASLYLGTRTPMDAVARKLERNQWLLDVVVDTDSDRGGFTPSDGAFEAIFAAIEASSRWRSLVVESTPAQADMPEDVVNRHLQRCSNATMSRFTTFKIKSTCKTSPLLNGLLRILGTTASSELTTVDIHSANVISFLVPDYTSMFNSVKVLSLNTPGLPDPVDLLPHLYHLEIFTVSHISFPAYHDDVDLPFVHTLRHLSLKAASIQWMSGRTFHVLEHCTLIFPLHSHILHTFSTTLPNCQHLTFQGYPLEILGGVSAHKLAHLSVTCSGSFNRRGSRQLLWLSRQVLGEGRLAPRILHISIEAISRAWVNSLALMSNLEELVIHSARPSSLGTKVLQSLVIQPVHAGDLDGRSTPGASGAPLCPLLQRFGLKYDRWLRPSEEFDLIPVFASIIQSRQHSNCSLRSFGLWTWSGQKEALELIEGSQINVEKFDYLHRMMRGNAVDLVARWLGSRSRPLRNQRFLPG